MVPHKTYAKYLFIKLYFEKGRKKETEILGRRLLHDKSKTKSFADEEIGKGVVLILNISA